MRRHLRLLLLFCTSATLTAKVPGVPEPETIDLVGTGLVGLPSAVRRRHR